MRAYSRVAPQFWTGATGRALRAAGRDAQVVALYLITCPDALMTGVFYLPFSRLCEETGVRPGRARAALEVLRREGFAEYDVEASVVWVPEMARFQVGRDPKPDDKRIKGFLRELEAAPHPGFVKKFLDKYREAFQLDEESLRGVLRGGFARKTAPSEAPPEPHQSSIEGPSEPHRSPIPAPAPAPAPEPGERRPRSRPTLDQVREFWKTGGPHGSPLRGDPDAFFDHHETYDWQGKKGPIRNWRAAARTWDRLEPTFTSRSAAQASTLKGRQARSSSRGPDEWDLAGEELLPAESAPPGKPQ